MKNSLRLPALLICLLSITGCFPMRYYRPSAAGGTPVPISLHAMELLRFKEVEGASVVANASLDGRDTLVRLTAAVGSKRTLQFTSDLVIVSNVSSHVTQEIKIPQIDSYILTKTNGVRAVHGTLDKLETPDTEFITCNFFAEIRILNFQPTRFAVLLPDLLIDGKAVKFPPVNFESKLGIDWWTDGP